jgi:hypothetical protein
VRPNSGTLQKPKQDDGSDLNRDKCSTGGKILILTINIIYHWKNEGRRPPPPPKEKPMTKKISIGLGVVILALVGFSVYMGVL